jgi:hypothetical protein
MLRKLAVALGISICPAAVAEQIILVDHGGNVAENYYQQVRSLKAGDEVVYRSRQFVLGRELGRGDSNIVFEIDGTELAIRIPWYKKLLVEEHDINSLHSYLKNTKILNRLDVPTVVIFESMSVPSEFLIVKRENIVFDFAAFVLLLRSEQISAELMIAEERLIHFSRLSAHMSKVSDLHHRNLVYNGEKWLALDFSGEIETSSKPIHDPLFDTIWGRMGSSFLELPESTKMRILSAIQDQRALDCVKLLAGTHAR